MTAGRRVRCWIFGLLAVVALVATWSQNIAFFAGGGDTGLVAFVRGAWANHAAASLGYDVVLVAVAAVVFMVAEGRRVGVRHAWAFVVLAAVVAVSVAFPLFLIARERRLAAMGAARSDGRHGRHRGSREYGRAD